MNRSDLECSKPRCVCVCVCVLVGVCPTIGRALMFLSDPRVLSNCTPQSVVRTYPLLLSVCTPRTSQPWSSCSELTRDIQRARTVRSADRRNRRVPHRAAVQGGYDA